MKEELATSIMPLREDTSPDNALAVWLRLQKSLAEKNDIALLTMNREGGVIGRIENDNSICRAMRMDPDHALLCAADCANACERTLQSGGPLEYTCHAGLRCFAIPVTIGKEQLVILGGRAFTSTADYTQFLRDYADLDSIASGEALKNIKFMDGRDLRAAAEMVDATAAYHFHRTPRTDAPASGPAQATPELMTAHLEIIRLSDQLETRRRALAQFYDFLRSSGASLDSKQVYHSVLAKFSEILKTERVSLMVLNDESNELEMEAALGAHPETGGVIRLKLGEGVAGAVLQSGTPLMVRDADTDTRLSHASAGSYRSKSFISFPITLGARKVGVINLTERKDGLPYGNDDLSLLELMSPHLALIIDRTEWHRKAETYQQMSLTDPLTALPNRRYLDDRLFEEVERSKRYGTPLAFMIIDVDHFKSYNDLYGHTDADRVLVKTAQILRNSIRAIDMSARFAGDEFCIVLPETDLESAARIADRLRAAVGSTDFFSESGELIGKVTLSIGVSSFSRNRQTPLVIVQTADRALYRAKTYGRNCVAVYADETADV